MDAETRDKELLSARLSEQSLLIQKLTGSQQLLENKLTQERLFKASAEAWRSDAQTKISNLEAQLLTEKREKKTAVEEATLRTTVSQLQDQLDTETQNTAKAKGNTEGLVQKVETLTAQLTEKTQELGNARTAIAREFGQQISDMETAKNSAQEHIRQLQEELEKSKAVSQATPQTPNSQDRGFGAKRHHGLVDPTSPEGSLKMQWADLLEKCLKVFYSIQPIPGSPLRTACNELLHCFMASEKAFDNFAVYIGLESVKRQNWQCLVSITFSGHRAPSKLNDYRQCDGCEGAEFCVQVRDVEGRTYFRLVGDSVSKTLFPDPGRKRLQA